MERQECSPAYRQTDTQLVNGGVNSSLQAVSSCDRSQLCPCKWKTGQAAVGAPFTEKGPNQPGRGWDAAGDAANSQHRDATITSTREVMGAHMGRSQM